MYVCVCSCLHGCAGRLRDLGVEERLGDLQGKIRELEKQNTTLKSKVSYQYMCTVHVLAVCIGGRNACTGCV